MEIEAKFALPNLDTFQRLQAIQEIAGFALSSHQILQMRDTYLDTPGRAILEAGYVCRARELESLVLVTVKRLQRAEGPVHRREEIEVSLPAYRPPAEWPVGPARDLVLGLIDEAPLVPLFELHQTRVVRRLTQGARQVADLSLDKVRLRVGERAQSYLELEVELGRQGTEDDIGRIVAQLQDEWGLEPRSWSKFDRAMSFLSEVSAEELMTAKEHAVCVEIAKRDDLHGRRARGLLALHDGLTQAEAADRAGRSTRTVRRWLTSFTQERLGAFPDRVLKAAGASSAAAVSPPSPVPLEAAVSPQEVPQSLPPEEPEAVSAQSEPHAEPRPAPESIDSLFDRYRVDRTHARAVADHALALFQHLSPYHGLPPGLRSLLETAALVHNIGVSVDPDNHDTTGRDILLDHPLEGLNDVERLVVALTTFLHRKRMTAKKLDRRASMRPFADLTGEKRREALVIAALVRIADGLDYSQGGTSEIGLVRREEDRVEIEVEGPNSAVDAGRAAEKSDLWHLLFDTKLVFTVPEAPSGETAVTSEEEGQAARSAEPVSGPAGGSEIDLSSDKLPEYAGLAIEDTMAEAARKTFAFHYRAMLLHEPGTRQGDDIEELHDMRVATRRMRSAFQVFEDYLDMVRLKPILKGLRETGGSLGAVRDLDVFWDKTQRYLDALSPPEQDDLSPLRRAWEVERQRMREAMLAFLDSDRYVEFAEHFAGLLESPNVWGPPPLTKKGEAVPHRLRHVVPMAIYERVADVLAYDEWVSQPNVALQRLHRLRIAAKRLRYTLEFFEEVLAPQARGLIREIKKLQDHLGDLQDAVVASELLRDFLTWGTWGHAEGKKQAALPSEPIVAPGVAIYLAERQRELQQLLAAFPETWSYFQSREFKRVVAEVVEPL